MLVKVACCVALCLLVSLSQGAAPLSTYVTVCGAGFTVQEAFDAAWGRNSAAGPGCAHLATYESEEDLLDIRTSIANAGATRSIIGARRVFVDDDDDEDDDYNLTDDDELTPDEETQLTSYFSWAAGAKRGQSFVGTDNFDFIQNQNFPVDRTTDGVCFQEFCLFSMNQVLPTTSGDQVGLAVDISNLYNQLVPTASENCYTYMNPSRPIISKINGGTWTITSSASDWLGSAESLTLNLPGLIPIITSAKQNEWVTDEMQCPALSNTPVYMGYRVNPFTESITREFGPNSGDLLDCAVDYCATNLNYDAGFNEGGVAVNADGRWTLETTGRMLYEATTCWMNAGTNNINLYRDFDGISGFSYDTQVAVCHIEPGQRSVLEFIDAYLAYSLYYGDDNYFLAGTSRVVNGDGDIYYFDCECQAPSWADATCFSEDPDISQYCPYYASGYSNQEYGNNFWQYLYCYFGEADFCPIV